MRYTADDDFGSWNSEAIYFRDGEGLLVPGYEDNIVYERASDEDNKSWVMEIDRGIPDRFDDDKPYYIRKILARYLKERLYYRESAVAYHVYGIGNPGQYWKVQSWYHSFDFKINSDTILIEKTPYSLRAFINKKEIKYTDFKEAVNSVTNLGYCLADLFVYLDKKYFADDYDMQGNAYIRYMDLMVMPALNEEHSRDFNTVKQEAMTDKKKKANEDWEADTDPMKDFRRPRRESKKDFSINKLFESVLRESVGGLSEEDKDEVLKAFRKNNIKIIETSEEYESGMYCFEVIAGNSNPTMIGYLHDDLYALESRGICFDETENEEGFYGRTFVFYYLDDNE